MNRDEHTSDPGPGTAGGADEPLTPSRGEPTEFVGPAAVPGAVRPEGAQPPAATPTPAAPQTPPEQEGRPEHADHPRATMLSAADAPRERLRQRLRIPVNAHVCMLTTLMTLTFLVFVLVEPTPRWVLIFGAIIAVLGVDGTLRATWRGPFSGPMPVDSTPYLFLPALFVLATPILIEHNARGYAVIPAAIAGGIAFGAIVIGELLSVHDRGRAYGAARWVVAAGAYFVAFTLFALPYVFDLSLRTSIGAVALVSLMLALELLREGQVDPLETIIYAFVTGLILGELRWSLHYLPIDGYLAGLALVLAFFLVTGVIGSYLTRRLDTILAVEYAIVGALGLALVVFARASGAA